MNAAPRHLGTAWYELLTETPARERKKITLGFLKMLHKQGALGMLPEIVRIMEDIEAARTGNVAVTVTAARDVDEAAVKKLATALVGEKSVRITRRKNEHVLGGVRIETKNKRWDLSIASALSQLRKQLQ